MKRLKFKTFNIALNYKQKPNINISDFFCKNLKSRVTSKIRSRYNYIQVAVKESVPEKQMGIICV
jgi:hypothetical protein